MASHGKKIKDLETTGERAAREESERQLHGTTKKPEREYSRPEPPVRNE